MPPPPGPRSCTATQHNKTTPHIHRSQPVNAIIPHDSPALVYNTRYFGRDHRRNSKYGARSVDRAPLDVDAMVASLPLTPEDVKHAPRPDAVRSRGT